MAPSYSGGRKLSDVRVWIIKRCGRVTCWVLLLSVVSAQAQGQQGDTLPARWPAFVAAFDSYALADSVVGASVLIMQHGRVIAHHEWGLADRQRRESVDERTIYHWASITKTLTAIGIMQLRDRGLLTLDDKVTNYVPELRRVHNPFGSMDAITIRMLLSHTAGFQNPTWPYKAGKPWEPFEPTQWEQLVSMMPYQEIGFRPGSQFGYSNPAFIYLARIIEQLTGDPYEVYIQKNIWTPLGLSRSYFGVTPYHLARWRSNNYTVTRDSAGVEAVIANGRDFDPGITIPNGGWNAPLGDLVKYAAFLTNATGGDTAVKNLYDTVLKRSSIEEMWKPVMRLPPGSTLGSAVGLSFFLVPQGLVEHSGYQAGFRSLLLINPRTAQVIILAFNTANEADAERADERLSALVAKARAVIER
jgi:CubicO group peptidase (beta-lactamase class C family)